MQSKYIWFCSTCNSVKFDTSNVECNLCRNKMEDVGFIESIEDAIWWGQKHQGVAISPSISWLADKGYLTDVDDYEIGTKDW